MSFTTLRGADILDATRENVNRGAYEHALTLNSNAGYLSNAAPVSIAEVRRLLPIGQRFVTAWPLRQDMAKVTEAVRLDKVEQRNIIKQNSQVMLSQAVGEAGSVSRMDWNGERAYHDKVSGWIHVYKPGSWLDVAYLPTAR